MSDWQLAQGTVDFRNEERRAAWGRSNTPTPAPPAVCPNCLTDLDDSNFCDGCGKVFTAAAARAVLESGQAYAAGRTR